MKDTIRTVRVEEFEDFMRFLEVCFGHSKGLFQREFPHLYQPDAESCGWGHVLERGGRLASHVGVYPIDVVIGGAAFPVGGIGGVCTAPDQRGNKGMTRLLHHVIGVMRDQGFVASALGGDRHRYGAFGWEYAGQTYSLRFSGRSLDRAGVKAERITDVLADEALATVERCSGHRTCTTRRSRLALQLQKQRLRFLLADDGYVIGYGENWGTFSIVEMVSVPGHETGLIRAVLARTNCGEAVWTVSAWEREVLVRVMLASAGWSANTDWDYRIVSLPGLLKAGAGLLTERAAALKDFDVAIGMIEHDRTDWATVTVEDGAVGVERGRKSKRIVKLDPVSAVRLIFGGPPVPVQPREPAGLRHLFPMPFHIPPLDHV